MTLIAKLFWLLVILTVLICVTNAIQCYTCLPSSNKDERCKDETHFTVTNCTSDKHCYKEVSTRRDSHVITTRSCINESEMRQGLKAHGCVEFDESGIQDESCLCYHDLCNSAGKFGKWTDAVVAYNMLTLVVGLVGYY